MEAHETDTRYAELIARLKAMANMLGVKFVPDSKRLRGFIRAGYSIRAVLRAREKE